MQVEGAVQGYPSLTTFVGRARDLAELNRRLAEGSRLITLLGPPGMGKTRLAARLLDEWRNQGGQGQFCDLRHALSREDVVTELGRTLGIHLGEDEADAAGTTGLAQALASRGRLLLVLDNLEQVGSTVPEMLHRWLLIAPELRLLTTSRRVLRVAGEVVYEVGPLGLPGSDDDWDSDAMQLFLVRARSVEPAFEKTTPRAKEVASLVRYLEGVPLAIELSASQMQHRGSSELLATLRSGLLSMSDDRSGIDPRHRSLRVAIEGSWRLLEPWAQAALVQLTTFRGGVTGAAAEAVLDLDGWPGAPPTVAIMAVLRDASLLRPDPEGEPDGSARWDMFEAVREYCKEQGDAFGQTGCLRSRHADYYLSRGEAWVAALRTRVAASFQGLLARELGNLKAAFDWFANSSPPGDSSQVLRMARVVVEASRDWAPRVAVEVLGETLRWGEVPAGLSKQVRADLRMERAALAAETGDYRAAESDLESAAEQVVPGSLQEAVLACEWGVFHQLRGEPHQARNRLESALTVARAEQNEQLEARCLRFLAWVLADAFQDPVALDHYPRAVELFRGQGDVRQEVPTLVAWSAHRVFFGRGDLDPELSECLALARRHKNRWAEIGALIAIGIHRQDQGDLDGAEEVLLHARDLAEHVGLRRYQAAAEMHLATVLDERGEGHQAKHRYVRATEQFASIGEVRLHGLCHVFLAGLVAREGNAVHAVHLIDRAAAILDQSGDDGFRREAELQRAQVELAMGRAAVLVGDRRGAEKHKATARGRLNVVTAPRPVKRSRQMLPPLVRCCPDARFVLRMLHRELSKEEEAVRQVDLWEDGSAFRVGSAPKVPLPPSAPLRRILAALVHQRQAAPGQALTHREIVALGWPGERVAPEAASIRVRNAISRLRKAGLGQLVVTARSGYLLDGAQPFRVVPEGADDLTPLTIVNG